MCCYDHAIIVACSLPDAVHPQINLRSNTEAKQVSKKLASRVIFPVFQLHFSYLLSVWRPLISALPSSLLSKQQHSKLKFRHTVSGTTIGLGTGDYSVRPQQQPQQPYAILQCWLLLTFYFKMLCLITRPRRLFFVFVFLGGSTSGLVLIDSRPH